MRGLFTRQTIQRLIDQQVLNELQDNPGPFKRWSETVDAQVRLASQFDRIGEISWLELSQYMRSTLLRDTDMMSMAHSLEVRVPLVDHRLVERVLPVRWERKVSRKRSKPLLAERGERPAAGGGHRPSQDDLHFPVRGMDPAGIGRTSKPKAEWLTGLHGTMERDR